MNNFRASVERRRYPRHNIRSEVVLFGQHSSFRTNTVNLSLSGALLEASIPNELMAEVLDVVLIIYDQDNIQRILLHGVIVGTPGNSNRIAFVNTPMIQFMKLQDLLVRNSAAS